MEAIMIKIVNKMLKPDKFYDILLIFLKKKVNQ